MVDLWSSQVQIQLTHLVDVEDLVNGGQTLGNGGLPQERIRVILGCSSLPPHLVGDALLELCNLLLAASRECIRNGLHDGTV